MCNSAFIKPLKEGDPLITEGEEPKGFYILLEGTLLQVPSGETVNIAVTPKIYR